MDAWTDGPRTDDLLRTKISWMHRFTQEPIKWAPDLPNFLTHVAPLHALRALESSANTDEDDDDDDDQNNKNNKQQIIESLV